MWPIRDLSGDVIAFGARKLVPDDDGPEIPEHPRDPLFHKSRTCSTARPGQAGDRQARPGGRRRGLYRRDGLPPGRGPTAVATCGTAFGEDHIACCAGCSGHRLGAGEVIFTFDGDMAGRRAALRAFATEERFTTQTYVTVQADGLDPCDLRLEHGDAAVRDLVARRVPLYEFAIRSLLDEFDLDTAEGRIAALDAAAEFIARIKDDALRKVYAGRVDRWLGLNDPELILRRIAGHLPTRRPRPREARRVTRGYDTQETGNGHHGPFSQDQESPYDLHDPVVQLERQVLSSRCSGPGCADLNSMRWAPRRSPCPYTGRYSR